MVLKMLRKILNYSEEKTHSQLNDVAESYGARVFSKVRIADVVQIEGSGISNEDYSYALKAHFDFVITGEDNIALFVVEFDGPMHAQENQQNKDKIKNKICDHFNLSILRIDDRHISKKYNDLTLLSWILNVYFLRGTFDKAQEEGHIPEDEIFDPFFLMIHTSDGQTRKFPYWISRSSNIAIHNMHKSGKIYDYGSSGLIVLDNDGVLRGMEYIRITKTHGLYVTVSMREQNFRVIFSELLDELLLISLYEKIQDHFSNNSPLLPIQSIYERIKELEDSGETRTSHSTSRA